MPWTRDKQAFFSPSYATDGSIVVTVLWPFQRKFDVVTCDDNFASLEAAAYAAALHANLYNQHLNTCPIVAVEIDRPFRPSSLAQGV